MKNYHSLFKNRGLLPAPFYHQFFLWRVTLPGGNSDDDHTNDPDNDDNDYDGDNCDGNK